MIEQRFFVEGLAHASHLFGQDGEAAVVDPKRDVEDYLKVAEENGLRIVAIFNSHPHADFASGFIELAQRTGAKIYTSHLAPVTYDHVPARDGDRVRVGNLEVEIWETPGHSPDSLSFLLRREGKPVSLYTGDLLFVNDVGRPDLRDAHENPSALAEKLYDSLFGKVLSLPDDVKIYPAHGAGSLCGRAISSAPFSRVGQERQSNWALQIKDRAEFVRQMTANLPDRPPYFEYDVAINLRGAPPLSGRPPLRELSEADLTTLQSAGGVVVDTRPAAFFGAGHFPGSLNLGLSSAMFSTWAGFMVPGGTRIALVVGSAENAARAQLELNRIGFDEIEGFIEADSLNATRQLTQLSVCDLRAGLKSDPAPVVLDVRTAGEWKASHIPGALHVPLPQLPGALERIPAGQTVSVMCGSGYRSSIAASYLASQGYTRLQNVMGGMSAFQETKCPDFDPSDLVFESNTPIKTCSSTRN